MAIPTGRATFYEIALVSPDGDKWRIPLWVRAKGRRNIQDAATDAQNLERIQSVARTKNFEWNTKQQAYVSPRGWKIAATGRTQRECEDSPLAILPKLGA